MLTWSPALTPSRLVDWSLVTPAQSPPATLAGVPRSMFLTGGPFWSLGLDEIFARGRAAILKIQQLQGGLAEGAPIVMGPCDCRLTPIAAGLSCADDPIAAAFTASAAVRATTVSLAISAGGRALTGGEHFGVDNAVWGRRMHRIIRVNGDGSYQIRPPLREAVANAQAIDFNTPSCTMSLASSLDFSPPSPGLNTRLLVGKAAFVEYPGKVA